MNVLLQARQFSVRKNGISSARETASTRTVLDRTGWPVQGTGKQLEPTK